MRVDALIDSGQLAFAVVVDGDISIFVKAYFYQYQKTSFFCIGDVDDRFGGKKGFFPVWIPVDADVWCRRHVGVSISFDSVDA